MKEKIHTALIANCKGLPLDDNGDYDYVITSKQFPEVAQQIALLFQEEEEKKLTAYKEVDIQVTKVIELEKTIKRLQHDLSIRMITQAKYENTLSELAKEISALAQKTRGFEQ